MNLNFSVAVYCGAAKAGLVPKISWFSLKKNGNRKGNRNRNRNEKMDVEQDEGCLECVDH